MSTNLIREFFESSQLAGGNADYVESLYDAWLADASSVPAEWSKYFETFKGRESGDVSHTAAIARIEAAQKQRHAGNGAAAAPISDEHARKQAGVLRLLTAYRSRGHLAADLDPLGLTEKMPAPDLGLAFHGLSDADLDTEFDTGNYAGGGQRLKLRDFLSRLQKTYASTIGTEFMHISNHEQRNWIYSRLEQAAGKSALDKAEKQRVLDGLTAAEGLERYLHTKYVGQKRFSLEGGDSMIPMIDDVVRAAGDNGIKELVIGMAHRGRLNVLVNILGKPPKTLFDEFEGKFEHPDDPAHSGDVKYHMGFSADVKTPRGGVHVALAFNPSHLEIVNPVVTGSVHARQTRRRDTLHTQSLAVLIHGDAAFAGQGVNMELLNMSQARGFKIGGSLHIVINNQVGFTTSNPQDARSTMYCTDLAKMVNAPVLHVNGDDPEAVIAVTRLAYDFRKQFRRDVVIDLVCSRRHGHNEADEPAFTQPIMYRAIAAHPTTREIYRQRLIDQGLLAAADADGIEKAFLARLEGEFEAAKSYRPNKADWLEGAWKGFTVATSDDRRGKTAVDLAALRQVGAALTQVPEGFHLNRKIARQLEAKREAIEKGEGIDWATAEALAFGTLLTEGAHVRLSGQDSGRGTFSQRHAVFYDQETEERYVPLNYIREGQQQFEVIDSPLSEAAVLGFEYGYSLADPRSLVLWEAQFGDFANGAQVMIDQFIASGEAKWLRMSGLVLLLPHGYEGQGPEHSSARLERFLQLCGEDNIQVCNLTSAANYFHALRRQVRRNFRKPLIVMTPKSLLRNPDVAAQLADMGPGTSFHRVFGEIDKLAPDAKIRRVLMCSGKVYLDLLHARRERKIDDIAILRIEQLYPFPSKPLAEFAAHYPNAEFVWVQEEPENMGAWSFVDRRIEKTLSSFDGKARRARYVGRPEAAATATGLLKRHAAEQARLVDEALAP